MEMGCVHSSETNPMNIIDNIETNPITETEIDDPTSSDDCVICYTDLSSDGQNTPSLIPNGVVRV